MKPLTKEEQLIWGQVYTDTISLEAGERGTIETDPHEAALKAADRAIAELRRRMPTPSYEFDGITDFTQHEEEYWLSVYNTVLANTAQDILNRSDREWVLLWNRAIQCADEAIWALRKRSQYRKPEPPMSIGKSAAMGKD